MSDITKGEWMVGIGFNPSADKDVRDIKQMAADLIDRIEACGKNDRCTALAITAFEDGAMWAVKSVTKKPHQKKPPPADQ